MTTNIKKYDYQKQLSEAHQTVMKKAITMKMAIKMERDLLEKGRKFNHWRIIFIQAVRKFRVSGAWAITPQHHGTFGAWCGYASKKTGIAKSSLQSFGTPNYLRNHFNQNMRRRMKGYCLYVEGDAAKILRQASIVARSILWPERVNLNGAIQIVAEYYLQHHKGKKLPKGILEIMTDSKRKIPDFDLGTHAARKVA